MKHRSCFIILFIAATISGLAQNIGETFFIYRNDGGFNAFFRDEVVDIEYSYEDAEGNIYDEIVTQIINTKDSVYKISLAAIDSVGFVTPCNVYKSGVVKLENDIRNYILSIDSLTIYFSSDTPAKLLPKVGEPLFTEEVSKTIPNGFIGKVDKIQSEDGRIIVSCSKIKFEDVFDYYFYSSDNDTNAKSRHSIKQTDSESLSRYLSWSPGTYHIQLTDFITPYIYPDPLGELPLSFSNKTDFSFSVTPSYGLKYIRIVTPSRGTEVTIDLKEQLQIVGDLSMSNHINWTDDILTTKDIPFVKLGVPFIYLYGKLGAFFSAEATIFSDKHLNQTHQRIFHYEARSRNPFATRASINKAKLVSNSTGEILIKGGLETGIYGEIGLAFMDSEIASLAYRGEVGVGMEGNTMLYRKDIENSLSSTDTYKKLQNKHVDFKWFYRTGIPAKLLWFEWPNNNNPHENILGSVGLVPNFSDTKLERDKSDNTKLIATTTVDGSCLPVDIGFSLFEKQSEMPISTQYSRYGYLGMNEKLSASFTTQSTSSDFKVYPTVAFQGIEMIAEPNAELEDYSIIGVWEVVSVYNIYGNDDGVQKGDYIHFNADNTYYTSADSTGNCNYSFYCIKSSSSSRISLTAIVSRSMQTFR